MDDTDKFMICAFLIIVILSLLNLGGCEYKEYKLEKQRLEAQAAGKLPPPNVQIRKLDDEQFRLLLEALQNKEQK